MNKLAALSLMTVLVNSGLAQLSSLPTSSVADGIVIRSKGINGGTTHWDSSTGLGAYRYTSDGPVTPNMGSPDNILGLRWANSAPASFSSLLSSANSGLTFRSIFVGASAGWQNDFGYTYTGQLEGPDAFTVFKNISTSSTGATVAFGDYVDVPLLPGENLTFDLWLNGVGGPGEANPPTPTDFGGIYTVLHPAQSRPYVGSGNISWAQSPLMVNTWIPALNSYQDVATYLVGIEDWRLDRGSDNDRNDFLFGIQIFPLRGNPIDQAPPFEVGPVPEPAAYGWIAVASLVGLGAYRRIRKAGSSRQA